MQLKEYIAHLQKIAKKYPDLEVVYSADDEGNNYGTVHYSPTIGEYNLGKFSTEVIGDKEPNAVCIN
jgi:UDP-N-acetylglucosamine 2-epimerase